MRRISSDLTFFHKRIFPFLWFGILGLILVVGLKDGGKLLPIVLIPIVMMLFGYVVMRILIFGLLDEVLDDGDALVLRNGGQEERVAFTDIRSVDYRGVVRPQRVVLSLKRPTIFGDKVVFAAPTSMLPFMKSEDVTTLIAKVERARQKATR